MGSKPKRVVVPSTSVIQTKFNELETLLQNLPDSIPSPEHSSSYNFSAITGEELDYGGVPNVVVKRMERMFGHIKTGITFKETPLPTGWITPYSTECLTRLISVPYRLTHPPKS